MPKWIELVSGVRDTTKDSYFVTDGEPYLATVQHPRSGALNIENFQALLHHDQPSQQLLSSCGLPFQSVLWCQYSEKCKTIHKMLLSSISTKWLDKTSCCSNFWKIVKDKKEQNMLSGLLHINVHRQRHHTETETGSILTSSWRAI